jgi:predicted adenine nucleotide alpha hydrolase (AANH) superfamily ATPase
VVTGYFYNPNIHREEEYNTRLNELRRFSETSGFKFIQGNYDSSEWAKKTIGLESEPEGGKRCDTCFRIRLEKTAGAAKERGFEAFATTLTISPRKKALVINRIGKELEDKYKVRYLSSDFKKKDGFKRSVELSKAHGLKRQDYCGCIYSLRDKRPMLGAQDK